MTGVPAYERARRGLRPAPERWAVFGFLTVRENLALAAPTRPSRSTPTRGCGRCWSAGSAVAARTYALPAALDAWVVVA